jgi:hypothetical protein
VTRVSAAGASAQPGAADFAEAHRLLLADKSIQFELAPPPTRETPAWLVWLGEQIIALLPLLKLLWWIGLVLAGIFLLYLIAARLLGLTFPWERWGRREPETQPSLQLPEAPARALLAQADALAAAGQYSEAARHLLFRSIEHIDEHRPDVVRPAYTSRDIAEAAELPPGPRSAFASIAMLVERSLFGRRSLGPQDWIACRSAYERFAFADEWQ